MGDFGDTRLEHSNVVGTRTVKAAFSSAKDEKVKRTRGPAKDPKVWENQMRRHTHNSGVGQCVWSQQGMNRIINSNASTDEQVRLANKIQTDLYRLELLLRQTRVDCDGPVQPNPSEAGQERIRTLGRLLGRY